MDAVVAAMWAVAAVTTSADQAIAYMKTTFRLQRATRTYHMPPQYGDALFENLSVLEFPEGEYTSKTYDIQAIRERDLREYANRPSRNVYEISGGTIVYMDEPIIMQIAIACYRRYPSPYLHQIFGTFAATRTWLYTLLKRKKNTDILAPYPLFEVKRPQSHPSSKPMKQAYVYYMHPVEEICSDRPWIGNNFVLCSGGLLNEKMMTQIETTQFSARCKTFAAIVRLLQ